MERFVQTSGACLVAFALVSPFPTASLASTVRLEAFVSDAADPSLNESDFNTADSTDPIIDTGATEAAQVSRTDPGAVFYDAYSYYSGPSNFGGYARTKPIEFFPDKVEAGGSLNFDVTRSDASLTTLDYRISNAELALEDYLYTPASAELFMSVRVRAPGETAFIETQNSFARLSIESGVFDLAANGVFTNASGAVDADYVTGAFEEVFQGETLSGVRVDFNTLNGSLDISDFAIGETYEVRYLWSATVTGRRYANAQFYDPVSGAGGIAFSGDTLAALDAGGPPLSPVPLPGAGWALAAGLTGLGLFRKPGLRKQGAATS